MRIPVQTPADLGVVIRALRKSAAVRQDDLAASVGVSKQFASDVEHGKPTAQVGLLMKVLEELGGRLQVEVPDHLQPMVAELQQRFVAQQGKHQKRSRRATRATDADQPGEDR